MLRCSWRCGKELLEAVVSVLLEFKGLLKFFHQRGLLLPSALSYQQVFVLGVAKRNAKVACWRVSRRLLPRRDRLVGVARAEAGLS